MTDIRAARAALGDAIPAHERRAQSFPSSLRAASIQSDGKTFAELCGCASAIEQPYEMWDAFGPYREIIAAGAFDLTLSQNPDVVFLENHEGRAMARTGAGTLDLSVDAEGLQSCARLNPTRTDVADLIAAVNDGAVTEMSFAFRIVSGMWSPDYTEYRITEVDLERGDVSAVTYGANPFTSIAARAASSMGEATADQLRAFITRASARLTTLEPTVRPGSSVQLLRARLDL